MLTRRDFGEMLASELVSVTGGLLAGTLLAFMINEFTLIPGMLILLPGFLELHGGVEGSLSARLSSGLWLGVMRKKGRMLHGNVVAAELLAILISLALGIVAYAGSLLFFGIADPRIIIIALFAGIISHALQTPLTVFFTFWIFRHGHDPNNIMGPYVTTIGDIVSVISLLIAILLVGAL